MFFIDFDLSDSNKNLVLDPETDGWLTIGHDATLTWVSSESEASGTSLARGS
jgi:hypothetical protein